VTSKSRTSPRASSAPHRSSTFKKLRRELDVAFEARDGKDLLRCYRQLSAMRRDGRVGRRRACPICLALTRPQLSGEVIHTDDCALGRALNEVEAFLISGGKTRDIEEVRSARGRSV
jgi:hypothetical protein